MDITQFDCYNAKYSLSPQHINKMRRLARNKGYSLKGLAARFKVPLEYMQYLHRRVPKKPPAPYTHRMTITPDQMVLLKTVASSGTITQTALSERTGMSRTTIRKFTKGLWPLGNTHRKQRKEYDNAGKDHP